MEAAIGARKAIGIRRFRTGDEKALHAVFLSAVHELASKDYRPEQIHAWAPADADQVLWAQRMLGIQPFVVEVLGQIVAYADVQPSGYIDHFFVAASHARRGLGTLLMNRVHEAAVEQSITELTSHVSLTAQPFFERHGFIIIEQRLPVVRGVVLPNALMRKELPLEHSSKPLMQPDVRPQDYPSTHIFWR